MKRCTWYIKNDTVLIACVYGDCANFMEPKVAIYPYENLICGIIEAPL